MGKLKSKTQKVSITVSQTQPLSNFHYKIDIIIDNIKMCNLTGNEKIFISPKHEKLVIVSPSIQYLAFITNLETQM